ncbi:hypothetical protein FB599_1512 [Herbaspirillum sp. SJZ130]|nr:hypothetical protein FB599_1512 [Herbaspirillum sp. SJZ130]TQK14162.1 hypothetical protein FB598_1530 [Herbaspirillum sp. SJZ106]TWC69861.1 hypothetical protein FB597_102467 [Herbaspirillum sp. SJZ099]
MPVCADQPGIPMSDRKKPNNLRTGLLLGLVALAFFVGIFVNRIWFAK